MKRLIAILVAVAVLSVGGVIAASVPASAVVACPTTASVVRIPRHVGYGYWQARTSCLDRRSGRAGDLNIGPANLSGKVCLMQMYGGYPLRAIVCGYNFSVTAYAFSFLYLATAVWDVYGRVYFSGSVFT